MKIVYSQPNCPGCVTLKNQLKSKGEEFIEQVIGKDITKEDFFSLYPGVRTVPYVVETPKE